MTMYVLIFWPQNNTKSILREENLRPIVDEGKETYATYTDGKNYLAKVLKKSYDRNYLEKLHVSFDGDLIKPPKKAVNRPARVKEAVLVMKKKDNAMKTLKFTQERNNRLEQESPIFNESPTSQRSEENDIHDEVSFEDGHFSEILNASDSSDHSDETINRQRKRKLSVEKHQGSKEIRQRMRDNFGQNKERDELARIKKQNELERMRERDELTATARTRERDELAAAARTREREELERVREENEHAARIREKRELMTRLRELEQVELAEKRDRNNLARGREDVDDEENEDPLQKCRKAGGGKVQLCSTYNVWIDKGELTYLQRWFNSPREMTRSLLKTLVGRENLKGMCARGRSKKTTPIPKEIMSAIEYYVNKKCLSRLDPAQFTNTVNMMCATLRNPK